MQGPYLPTVTYRDDGRETRMTEEAKSENSSKLFDLGVLSLSTEVLTGLKTFANTCETRSALDTFL